MWENIPSTAWYDEIHKGWIEVFKKKPYHDVRFVFTTESGKTTKVAANKLILMAFGDVFKAMFSGSIPEKGEVVMKDPTIDVTDFELFIDFTYTGMVSLNMQNFEKLLYIANKYHVRALEHECASFLQYKLKRSNVYEFLELVSSLLRPFERNNIWVQ